MNRTVQKFFVIIPLSFVAGAGLLYGQADPMVMCETNTTLLHEGGDWVPLTHELENPHDVRVFTNCTYQVDDGKERKLKDGQILRADGFLLNPDGSTLTVFDHLSMKGGVTVYKDGLGVPLAENFIFPDGTVVEPDGTYNRPGRRSRLMDGQLIGLHGTVISGLDTISYKHAKVTIFKGGTFIDIEPVPDRIVGMFDGTKVSGLGMLIGMDGSTRQLTEGETIVVPGVRADW